MTTKPTTRIHVLVHLKPDVLDVQGQAIQQAVAAAGHGRVAAVRQGKSFTLEFAGDPVADKAEIDALCEEVLSNPTIESWTWTAEPL